MIDPDRAMAAIDSAVAKGEELYRLASETEQLQPTECR